MVAHGKSPIAEEEEEEVFSGKTGAAGKRKKGGKQPAEENAADDGTGKGDGVGEAARKTSPENIAGRAEASGRKRKGAAGKTVKADPAAEENSNDEQGPHGAEKIEEKSSRVVRVLMLPTKTKPGRRRNLLPDINSKFSQACDSLKISSRWVLLLKFTPANFIAANLELPMPIPIPTWAGPEDHGGAAPLVAPSGE